MRMITGIVCLSVMLTVFCRTSLSAPVRVESEGQADGNVANARELALTDALREAVRQGAGIELLGASRVTDFVLDYDRIIAASFGHVKSYRVLRSGLGEDGIYRVRLEAVVNRGMPAIKDALAIRMIVRLKGSPRFALETDEFIEGLPLDSDFAGSWFEAAARDLHLQLVDANLVARQAGGAAMLRSMEVNQCADVIIRVRLRGRYEGEESLYGMNPMHRFSVTLDLKAFCPDTGAVLVSIPMRGRDELTSTLQSPELAARDLVHRMLDGKLSGQSVSAWDLFRRLFADWVVKMDLGVIRSLEFARISDVEFDAVRKALDETPKINGVWPRHFDVKGVSRIDVESRLDAAGLRGVVVNALGDAVFFEQGTDNRLRFAAARKNARAVSNPGSADHSKSGEAGSFPTWAWGIIGAGGMVMAGGTCLAIRSRRL